MSRFKWPRRSEAAGQLRHELYVHMERPELYGTSDLPPQELDGSGSRLASAN